MYHISPRTLIVTGLFLAAPLVLNPSVVSPANASGAYFADVSPTLPEICRELGVAFLAVALVNQSAPSIGRAMRLHERAVQGCQLNPRESIHDLQVALHLVTPQ